MKSTQINISCNKVTVSTNCKEYHNAPIYEWKHWWRINFNQQGWTTSSSMLSLWGLWVQLSSSHFGCPCPKEACSSKGKRLLLWARSPSRRGLWEIAGLRRQRWIRTEQAQWKRWWSITAALPGVAGRTWPLRDISFGRALRSPTLPGIFFFWFFSNWCTHFSTECLNNFGLLLNVALFYNVFLGNGGSSLIIAVIIIIFCNNYHHADI